MLKMTDNPSNIGDTGYITIDLIQSDSDNVANQELSGPQCNTKKIVLVIISVVITIVLFIPTLALKCDNINKTTPHDTVIPYQTITPACVIKNISQDLLLFIGFLTIIGILVKFCLSESRRRNAQSYQQHLRDNDLLMNTDVVENGYL